MLDEADLLLKVLTTSIFPNEAAGGTSTVMEKSEDDLIVPRTCPNHTCRFAGLALKPLPVITISPFGYRLDALMFVIVGTCALASPAIRTRMEKIILFIFC